MSEEPNNIKYTSGGEVLIDEDSSDRNALGELYESYNNLLTSPSTNQKSFEYILTCSKKTKKLKILAAQFIPKFFKHFEKLIKKSIDAIIDLVEDSEQEVRISAIKGLPLFCAEDKEKKFTRQIANVLGQLLLGCESDNELEIVEKSLIMLLKIDINCTLDALFEHIESRFKLKKRTKKETRMLKEKLCQKSISFIIRKVLPNMKNLDWTEEVELSIKNKIFPLIGKCGFDDFESFLIILKRLNMYKDLEKGIKPLINELIEKADLKDLANRFEVEEVDKLKKLLSLMKLANLLYAKEIIPNDKFLNFIVRKVLPKLNQLDDELGGIVLTVLADMSKYTSREIGIKSIDKIYNSLIEYLPLPTEEVPDPIVNIGYAEAFLISFVSIATRIPGDLNKVCGIKVYTGQPSNLEDDIDNSKKKEDFDKRLKFLAEKAKAIQVRMREQKDLIKKKPGETIEERDLRFQRIRGRRMVSNIIIMCSDLLKSQPKFSTNINPSWNKRKPFKKKKRKASTNKLPASKRRKVGGGGGYNRGRGGFRRGGFRRGGFRGGYNRGGFRRGRGGFRRQRVSFNGRF